MLCVWVCYGLLYLYLLTFNLYFILDKKSKVSPLIFVINVLRVCQNVPLLVNINGKCERNTVEEKWWDCQHILR